MRILASLLAITTVFDMSQRAFALPDVPSDELLLFRSEEVRCRSTTAKDRRVLHGLQRAHTRVSSGTLSLSLEQLCIRHKNLSRPRRRHLHQAHLLQKRRKSPRVGHRNGKLAFQKGVCLQDLP